MSKSKILLVLICLLTSLHSSYGQTPIKLEKKPSFILRSWYPEFKKFPKLKIGESKILYITTPEFKDLPIRNNDIDLRTANSQVKIEETEKTNQYRVLVNATEAKFVEFEVWLDLGDKTVLMKQNGKWQNVKEIYTVKENRILIDAIKVELIK
ncbi:hypothetical protein [Flavobacterium sp.]|uniref:hypothetical protein n=1 Tax=Flavobacterium sp. TaxID=239 RepID=UPI00260DF345|nr:hypothetical protein [Flavobacterium sp.]